MHSGYGSWCACSVTLMAGISWREQDYAVIVTNFVNEVWISSVIYHKHTLNEYIWYEKPHRDTFHWMIDTLRIHQIPRTTYLCRIFGIENTVRLHFSHLHRYSQNIKDACMYVRTYICTYIHLYTYVYVGVWRSQLKAPMLIIIISCFHTSWSN